MSDTTVEPIEEVEEVNPLALIAQLERDLAIGQAALRKIVRTNAALFSGGPSNQYFGRGVEKALDSCQKAAFKALSRMENHVDDDEEQDS